MIVGITGKARSGKTTVADHLVAEHGFVKINFKDALVEEMKERLPDVLDKLDTLYNTEELLGEDGVDRLFNYKPTIMRALMQNYGTEVRRGDDPDYWVSQWRTKVSKAIFEGKSVVTDDVRFHNEIDAVKLMGGLAIRVNRSDIMDSGSHQSETEMDSFEYDQEFLVNQGEQQLLKDMVVDYIKQYGPKE